MTDQQIILQKKTGYKNTTDYRGHHEINHSIYDAIRNKADSANDTQKSQQYQVYSVSNSDRKNIVKSQYCQNKNSYGDANLKNQYDTFFDRVSLYEISHTIFKCISHISVVLQKFPPLKNLNDYLSSMACYNECLILSVPFSQLYYTTVSVRIKCI